MPGRNRAQNLDETKIRTMDHWTVDLPEGRLLTGVMKKLTERLRNLKKSFLEHQKMQIMKI